MKRFALIVSTLVLVFLATVLRPSAQEPGPGRTQAPTTDGKLNIIAFGAHPDDCDIRAGGVAAKYAAAGHRVRFVAVTNGDAETTPRPYPTPNRPENRLFRGGTALANRVGREPAPAPPRRALAVEQVWLEADNV